jgi:hypothetical protein
MLDTDKVSLGLAAQYIGLTTDALEAMERAGWIKPVEHAAGRIPIYLGADLKRIRSAAPPETPEMKAQRLIREQHENLQAQIASFYIEIDQLREKCAHPNVVKENRGSSGNYDRSADRYWKECKCPDCGKRWTEEQ